MSLIKPKSLVFDIGANIGTVSEQFINAGAGKVIAIEPCFENYRAIVNRSRIDNRIVPVHAACWYQSDIIGVSYALNCSGWSSCQPAKWSQAYPEAQWSEIEYVPAVTLGQLVNRFGVPYLVKVDVEGSEFQVLKGMMYKSPYLMFEFHHKFIDDAIKCLRLCQKFGYRRAHYTRENIDLETEPTTLIDEFVTRWQADAPQWGNITVS